MNTTVMDSTQPYPSNSFDTKDGLLKTPMKTLQYKNNDSELSENDLNTNFLEYKLFIKQELSIEHNSIVKQEEIERSFQENISLMTTSICPYDGKILVNKVTKTQQPRNTKHTSSASFRNYSKFAIPRKIVQK